jgi:hypothetical protein
MEPSGKSPINLYIGTPCYGGQVTSAYFLSLLQLQDACAKLGVNLTVLNLWGEALITRARQNIVTCFLEDPAATHLLFIDSDIGFEMKQVFRLLDSGKDVSAGLYPLKSVHWDKVQKLAQEGKADLESASYSYTSQWDEKTKTENGFAKVPYAGTGFMMIRRSVFLAMMERYPQLRFSGGNSPKDPLRDSKFRYAFFNCLIDGNQYLSEDTSFCKLWTDMGGEIWGDFQSRLDHVGSMVFKGNMIQAFGAGPTAPAGGK